jgi:hypothetical protein
MLQEASPKEMLEEVQLMIKRKLAKTCEHIIQAFKDHRKKRKKREEKKQAPESVRTTMKPLKHHVFQQSSVILQDTRRTGNR